MASVGCLVNEYFIRFAPPDDDEDKEKVAEDEEEQRMLEDNVIMINRIEWGITIF